MGLRNALNFKYEQPDLITKDEELVSGLGSCKVTWTFLKSKITCDFTFIVKQQVTLDRMRYVLGIAAPHNRYHVTTAFTLGNDGHRTEVIKDDFQANWRELDVVTDNDDYRTYYGNMNYLQILERDRPLVMRSGTQYRLSLSFDPDIAFADE